jgi:glycine/D-amino acid oxidase-like deaminating enzyme
MRQKEYAGMKRYDVAVIGLGIVGASAVHALTRAGARVVGFEARAPGAGTSGSSFAWVNAVRKEPEVYHRLNADGMAAHRQLARELGGDAGYHETGSLEWAEDGDGEGELRARVERLAGRGYQAEWISVDRARRLEPGLIVPAHVREVAFYAGDGWLDAPRLIGRLLAAAAARGAEIREARPVKSVRLRGDRAESVIGDDGETVAESVLVCVGPATQSFLEPLGATVPLGRVPGLLAVTSLPGEPLGRVVHAPGIHLRPDVNGGLLLGAADVDGLVTDRSTPAAVASSARLLLERAQRVFPPARGVRLVDSRVGVRPMPADGQTIAGRIPGLSNAWVLATHSGVTLGPLLGRLIAAEIVGGTPSLALGPFRPERFTASGAGAAR